MVPAHGDTVWIEQGPLTIIAVDPGHATLVDAVRYHPDGVHIEPLPIEASRRQKRRHHLQQKLGLNDRTHFSLTNVHWQVVCGRRATKHRMQHLMSKMGLQPAIDVLSQHSSRVSTSVAYMDHLRARLATMDTMKRLVKAKAPSRWKFECYQKEQLAAHQLSKDLLLGCAYCRLGQRRLWSDISRTCVRTQQKTASTAVQVHASHTLQ
jgi:hypothetical protein